MRESSCQHERFIKPRERFRDLARPTQRKRQHPQRIDLANVIVGPRKYKNGLCKLVGSHLHPAAPTLTDVCSRKHETAAKPGSCRCTNDSHRSREQRAALAWE